MADPGYMARLFAYSHDRLHPAPPHSRAHRLRYTHNVVFEMLVAMLMAAIGAMCCWAFARDIYWIIYMIIGGLFVVAMLSWQPSTPLERCSWSGWLMCHAPIIALTMLLVWHLCFIKPVSEPSGFTMEPVVHALTLFIVQLLMSKKELPLVTKMAVLIGTSYMHMAQPVYVIGLWNETVLVLSANIIGMLCGYAINSDQQLLIATLEIAEMSRRADSRLNHVIKGQCGGANGLLSGLLTQLEMEAGPGPSEETRALLQQIHAMLDDAAEWCHQREVFVQLEARTYQMELQRIDLCAELTAQIGASGTVRSVGEVMVDATLVRLLVHEALSNAFKYRRPDTPIEVRAEMLDGLPSELHLTISNCNRQNVPFLSPDQCRTAFERAKKNIGHRPVATAVRSDGLGLDSVKLAVEAVGGRAWLTANKHFTEIHLTLPARTVTAADRATPIATPGISRGNERNAPTLRSFLRTRLPVSLPATTTFVMRHPTASRTARGDSGAQEPIFSCAAANTAHHSPPTSPTSSTGFAASGRPRSRSKSKTLSASDLLFTTTNSPTIAHAASIVVANSDGMSVRSDHSPYLSSLSEPSSSAPPDSAWRLSGDADAGLTDEIRGVDPYQAERRSPPESSLAWTSTRAAPPRCVDGLDKSPGPAPQSRSSPGSPLRPESLTAIVPETVSARSTSSSIAFHTTLVPPPNLAAASAAASITDAPAATADPPPDLTPQQAALIPATSVTPPSPPSEAVAPDPVLSPPRSTPSVPAALLAPAATEPPSSPLSEPASLASATVVAPPSPPSKSAAAAPTLTAPQAEAALAAAADSGNAPKTPSPPPPVCIGIDDSAMLRKMQVMLFRLFMHSDMSRSGSIGASDEECDEYVDVVMGKKTISLAPASLPPADIAVLDENIELDGEAGVIFGSDLVKELRQKGFKGVTCILTGAHRDKVAELSAAPGVDLAFEKNQDIKQIANALLEAHAKRWAELNAAA